MYITTNDEQTTAGGEMEINGGCGDWLAQFDSMNMQTTRTVNIYIFYFEAIQ